MKSFEKLLSNNTKNTIHFRPTCSSSNSPPSRAMIFILIIGVTSLSIVPSTYTVPSLLLILIGESVCNMVNWTWNGTVPSDKWIALAQKLKFYLITIIHNMSIESLPHCLTQYLHRKQVPHLSLPFCMNLKQKGNISFELKSGLY